jgi:branched-chain amino acid aminotransferase
MVPFDQAKVSVMTHALNYGTGVFEGIRGYWNEDKEEVYLLFLQQHFERLKRNTKMVFIDLPYSVDELVDMTVKLLRVNGDRCDVYIRPLAYKSSETIGVSMEGVADSFTMFAVPYGNYVPMDRGLTVCVSSWRRTSDNAIPGRAKLTGDYINSALAKNEAKRHGYDEAIVLNDLGYVCEVSAANIFLLRGNVLVTPSVADGILEGYTRTAVMQLALEELGISTEQRSVARTELYYADEIFLAGTGVQIAPVIGVDGRTVGTGEIGPVAGELQRLYFEAVRGRIPKYLDWLTPVNAPRPAPRTTVPAS